jgi:hypothetical protein
MGILDRFRTPKRRVRMSKYGLESINTKNELITALKDVIKAKDITIQAYKKSLSEVIDLEEDFNLKTNEPISADADLVDIITSTLTSREDVPRPLKMAITNYGETHRAELNSVLNQKVNQLISNPDKKDETNYGV